jgi:hypothetical protein
VRKTENEIAATCEFSFLNKVALGSAPPVRSGFAKPLGGILPVRKQARGFGVT